MTPHHAAQHPLPEARCRALPQMLPWPKVLILPCRHVSLFKGFKLCLWCGHVSLVWTCAQVLFTGLAMYELLYEPALCTSSSPLLSGMSPPSSCSPSELGPTPSASKGGGAARAAMARGKGAAAPLPFHPGAENMAALRSPASVKKPGGRGMDSPKVTP